MSHKSATVLAFSIWGYQNTTPVSFLCFGQSRNHKTCNSGAFFNIKNRGGPILARKTPSFDRMQVKKLMWNVAPRDDDFHDDVDDDDMHAS